MTNIQFTKACGKCGLEQPGDAFSKDKRARDGLQVSCRLCQKKYRQENRDHRLEVNRLYHAANRERLNAESKRYHEENREAVSAQRKRHRAENLEAERERSRRYQKDNAEQVKAQSKRWREENRESLLEEKRRYYQDNRTRLLERCKQYAVENAEAVSEYKKRWHYDNRDHVLAVKKRYYEENYEKVKAGNARRRARVMGAEGSYSAKDIERMYEDQAGLCAYCECALDGRWEVDHMVPLSRGGRNDPMNLAVACFGCNRSKHSKTVEEFVV